jgi:hypothetical protein
MHSWAGHSASLSDGRPALGPPSRSRAAAQFTYTEARSACRSEHLISTNVIFKFPAPPDPALPPPALQHASSMPHHSDCPALIPSVHARRSFLLACKPTASSARSTGSPGSPPEQWHSSREPELSPALTSGRLPIPSSPIPKVAFAFRYCSNRQLRPKSP